ncbi:MAG: C4-dicarboxylate ABC transporter, partial [Oceanospirillum sp.]|nr:C4-dicarboxylate ABC transporter [Oceanospirillum sp.]
MKKMMKATLAAASVSVAMSGIALDAQAADKKILLKVPVAYSTNLPALGTPIPKVAEQVRLVSNNTIRMKVYEPGKLVAPFEILDAVSRGKINAGYGTAGNYAGKIPASPLF